MWYIIALAYQEVTHSYGVASLDIPVSQLLILMGASMLGSMLQLPAVGGGSQMATIAALSSVFDVPPEMAASCGILLWLVTFAAVVPLGLILAHHERLSLRNLSEESHRTRGSESLAALRPELPRAVYYVGTGAGSARTRLLQFPVLNPENLFCDRQSRFRQLSAP